MSLRPLLVLVRKDLLLFFNDRRAVILSFAVPILLASFFAVIFGGAPGGGEGGQPRFSIGVADLDGSGLSRKIVEGLAEDEGLDVKPGGVAEVRDLIRRNKAVAGIVIPAGFGEAAPRAMFAPGPKPELTLLHDPTHAAEAAMVRGLLIRHVMESVSAESFGAGSLAMLRDSLAEVEKSDMGTADKAALLTMLRGILQWQGRPEGKGAGGSSRAGRLSVPFETKEEAVAAGGQEAKVVAVAHAFGGMAVQFLLFAAIESGIGLLTERQRGLWRRLRAAPVARWMLLLGRGISAAVIALMILAVIFLFGAFAFGIRVTGSVVGFGLVCVSFAACAASFGLLIAALGKTPQAARGLSAMAVLLMVMLGGAWVPTFVFPGWLQKVTPLLPTRWAVDGFDATLARGFTLVETLPIVLALVGFTAVFSIAAASRFRWEE
jgi:ABC-2 type transport system permease protein